MNRNLIAAAMAGAAAFYFGWWSNGHRHEARHQELIAQHQSASAKAISSVLERERNLKKTIEEIQDSANKQTEIMAAELADADAASERLHNTIDDLQRRYASDTAVAAECQAAARSTRVLAELLSESQSLAGVYASRAQQATIALHSCTASYEAIRISD